MSEMIPEEAVVDNKRYIRVDVTNITRRLEALGLSGPCNGCAGQGNAELCSDLPDCSTRSHSYIFQEAE